jgi:signal recognition particle GTPase
MVISMDDLAPEPATADTNALAATPETEVTEGTSNAADSAPASPEPAAPERDKVQERFDRLTKEKYDALRAADTERYQRERLQAELEALRTKPDPVVPETLPTLEQFEYDEAKYRTALAAYYKAEARREVDSAFKEREQQQRAQERTSTFQKRQAEFIASKPDYAEKVLSNPSLPITQDMREAILDSDLGPQVAYYLAENVEKAEAIAQLSPLAQAREIGRIEARLEAAKAPPPPAVSKAPPPPPSIAASDSVVDKDPDQMSIEEWKKWRDKRDRLKNLRK